MRARSAILLVVVCLAGRAPVHAQTGRPVLGVAFGGGSARGLAHIGVIQWFEEHHIPIDVAAGTSMGGLVGGAFATGMSAAELRELIEGTDWDVMFGSSSFPFKNLRRKEDARSYPSRLEFGLKGGIVPPTSLNSGQQVDLFIARIAAPYFALDRFDDLPTPFRMVAVDLVKGEKVVLDRGSFGRAMRATMSLPGIFPPVDMDGRVLVDGGALNNIPADVVREMGATVVIAISVGYAPAKKIDYSLFGLMGGTLDAMMAAGTRQALLAATHTINVDVEGFGSLDWRRAGALIERGYKSAERMRDDLLKYSVSESEWQAWLQARAARRRTTLPTPHFLATAGLAPTDARFARATLEKHVGKPVDLPALDKDLTKLSGLDRYEAINWQFAGPSGQEGLLVRAREKPYAPPFMMLGFTLENTASEDFRAQLAARYLAFDVGGSGAELRIDGVIGSDPSIAAVWQRPLGGSPLFVRPYAAATKTAFDVFFEDRIVAIYSERRLFVGGDVGINLSRISEVAAGLRWARLDTTVDAGDPDLPELTGLETLAQARWVVDGQDSPVVPSRGTRAGVVFKHYLESPDVGGFDRTNDGVTQLEGFASTFWTHRRLNRAFLLLSAGTSFDGKPLPTSQFSLGQPLRLDAFGVGERRGDHYGVATVGYLRQLARLPDFMGGPIFAGVWFENGSAFNSDEDADLNSHAGVGILMDTLVGPVLAAVTFGFDGGWRTLFGVGRVFR
jgi:NTE family protein